MCWRARAERWSNPCVTTARAESGLESITASTTAWWAIGTEGVLDQVTNQQDVAYRTVRSVLVDREHQVWAGAGSGLFPLQAEGFRHKGAGACRCPPCTRIAEVCCGPARPAACGAAKKMGWKAFTSREGLSANAVQAILDDAQGNLWVGTEGGGLNRFRDGKFTWFSRTNGLPSNNVVCLYRDAEGVLWVGTSLGLARYDGQSWRRYTKTEGLVSNSISYLVEDGQGYLWLGSDAGLMRVRKRALNDFAEKEAEGYSGPGLRQPRWPAYGRCTVFQPGAGAHAGRQALVCHQQGSGVRQPGPPVGQTPTRLRWSSSRCGWMMNCRPEPLCAHRRPRR